MLKFYKNINEARRNAVDITTEIVRLSHNVERGPCIGLRSLELGLGGPSGTLFVSVPEFGEHDAFQIVESEVEYRGEAKGYRHVYAKLAPYNLTFMAVWVDCDDFEFLSKIAKHTGVFNAPKNEKILFSGQINNWQERMERDAAEYDAAYGQEGE